MKNILIVLVFAVSVIFANSFSYIEYVDVVKSEPIYRAIIKRVPYQECWDEEVPVSSEDSSDAVGALLGGVAGAVLGHQVGKGGGKTAATVGGAIVGTLVGKNLSQKDSPSVEYRKVRRCRTRYDEHEERVQRGYKNYAYYNGQEIIKYSKTPLRRIKIFVTISY